MVTSLPLGNHTVALLPASTPPMGCNIHIYVYVQHLTSTVVRLTQGSSWGVEDLLHPIVLC